MVLTIIVFLLVLSVIVFVHEIGHFWTARKFKMRVDEFGFGLPPRMIGFRKKDGRWFGIWGKGQAAEGEAGGTIYSINWIPVGGFVKIKGDDGEDRNSHDSFATKPIWQRFITLVAGVSMNVILCAVLLSVGFMIGMPAFLGQESAGAVISENKIQIMEVLPDLPGVKADLKVGDTILTVNDLAIKRFSDLKEITAGQAGEVFKIKISRAGEIMEKEVEAVAYRETIGFGLVIIESATVRYPWYLAIWQGIKATGLWLAAIIVGFYTIIKNLIIGQSVGVEIAGPVGIAALTGEAARMGLIYILQFTALLSLNLAVINALPFPALDGGRILFLVIEKIRRRAVKQRLEILIHNIGFILLMILVVFVTYRDVAKYSGKIFSFFQNIIGL